MLTDAQVLRLESEVLAFLEENPSITNRRLRDIASVSYDEATQLFRDMLDRGCIKKLGKSSQTRYVRAEESCPESI